MYFWRCCVVYKCQSPKPDFRFGINTNPARSKSEVCNEDNLWQGPTGNET